MFFCSQCSMSSAHFRLSNSWCLPLPAPADRKCFQAISENVNNTLCPCCIPTALKQEYCVRGWWVSWESTEPVIMDKHLAPFPPERLQWPQPNHCLLRHWSGLAHSTKSTISLLVACLSHPDQPIETCCQAKHSLMKNKYNAVSLTTSQATNDSLKSNF